MPNTWQREIRELEYVLNQTMMYKVALVDHKHPNTGKKGVIMGMDVYAIDSPSEFRMY